MQGESEKYSIAARAAACTRPSFAFRPSVPGPTEAKQAPERAIDKEAYA
jgi:hypothetical protein